MYVLKRSLVCGFILKKIFFTNQLQVEKVGQYLLLEFLKSAYESSSDDNTKSSPVKFKRKRTEKEWSKLSAHTFWEGYDELIAEKNSRNDNTINKKSMPALELDVYLKIKCIPLQSSPYTWWVLILAANKN